jgi:DNA polymerase
MNKIEELNALSKIISNCHKCELSKTRNNVVIGDGNINSKILLVGEGPGYNEDLTGNAFVGPAGQLLDKELASIGLDRTKVYISNVVKCRPPQNRNPLPVEQEACINYLRKQYLIQKPKLIILLGAVAGKKLIDPNYKITLEHGKVIEKNDVIFIGTFHPSALLRDPSKKKLAWEDLKTIKKIIEENNLLSFDS